MSDEFRLFKNVIDDGADIRMKDIANCKDDVNWTLGDCERKCPGYDGCYGVMIANDILKLYEELSFDCRITDEYATYDNHDEWGCAYAWINDISGVEYNFCIECCSESEIVNSSAIYRMSYNEEEGIMETDYNSYIHYEIDFRDREWKRKLKEAMYNAFESFFVAEEIENDSKIS